MKAILFISAIIVLAGCSNSTNPPSSQQGLIGTWDWVQSRGGDPIGVENPATTGYHQQYTFRSDSTYLFVRTPDTTNAGQSGVFHCLDSAVWFKATTHLEPSPLVRLQFHGNDTLLLGDDSADGAIATYARVK